VRLPEDLLPVVAGWLVAVAVLEGSLVLEVLVGVLVGVLPAVGAAVGAAVGGAEEQFED
jgi:TctA family transporter